MKSTLDSLGQTINFEKVKKLSNNLMKYGFFDLPKLKQLSRKQQRTLLSHFIHSDYNYILAGLYHLGFIDVLLNAFPKSKIKAFKLLGSLFDYDPDGSNGRHNIAIIKDAKTHARHTSYQFIKQFADYYEKLKQG